MLSAFALRGLPPPELAAPLVNHGVRFQLLMLWVYCLLDSSIDNSRAAVQSHRAPCRSSPAIWTAPCGWHSMCACPATRPRAAAGAAQRMPMRLLPSAACAPGHRCCRRRRRRRRRRRPQPAVAAAAGAAGLRKRPRRCRRRQRRRRPALARQPRPLRRSRGPPTRPRMRAPGRAHPRPRNRRSHGTRGPPRRRARRRRRRPPRAGRRRRRRRRPQPARRQARVQMPRTLQARAAPTASTSVRPMLAHGEILATFHPLPS